MKVRDITAVLEAFAPLGIQESWDNSGLCIGSPEDEVHGVLLGFDCTPALVEEAAACGADIIVTHHPLIFHGIRKISPDDETGRAVMMAVKAGIAVYAAHTTADKVLAGVSGAMAARLGLKNVRILEPEENGAGLGTIGEFPEPMNGEEALAFVKERFGLKVIRSSRPLEGRIGTVAMCGGSGGSLIAKARAEGAQLYLSGDISYHNFFTPEGFMIMDIGHFESEVEIVEILFSLLRKNFPNFAVRISDELKNSNPVYYYG